MIRFAILLSLSVLLTVAAVRDGAVLRGSLQHTRLAASASSSSSSTDIECFVTVATGEPGYELYCMTDAERGLYYDITAAVSPELRETLETTPLRAVVRVQAEGALQHWKPVPPGTAVSLVRMEQWDDRRSSSRFVGVRSVLVVRMLGRDVNTSLAASTLSDAVFSTHGRSHSLKSQFQGCTKDILQFVPFVGGDVVDGVITVDTDMMLVGTSVGEIQSRVLELLPTRHNVDVANARHIMWAFPNGVWKGNNGANWSPYALYPPGKDSNFRGTFLSLGSLSRCFPLTLFVFSFFVV